MKYILEIYIEGDCLESREYEYPFICPLPGEKIRINFKNNNYNESYGEWLTVSDRKYLFINEKFQTIMLCCKPG